MAADMFTNAGRRISNFKFQFVNGTISKLNGVFLCCVTVSHCLTIHNVPFNGNIIVFLHALH
jgi:hypothetical protein